MRIRKAKNRMKTIMNRKEEILNDRKRKIAIIDPANEEIISELLKNSYETFFFHDAETFLEQNRIEAFDLLICDIAVLRKEGFRHALRKDMAILALGRNREEEAEALEYGASESLILPLPRREVFERKIDRIIRLEEYGRIIRETEYDPLTGLYNSLYFFRYAEKIDQFYPDSDMDALVFDIDRFHLINERYGRKEGDRILKKIAKDLKIVFDSCGALIGRKESDTFLVYCRHQENYRKILSELNGDLVRDRIKPVLRLGIKRCIGKTETIEDRFDRAIQACDIVKDNYENRIAYYDRRMFRKELFCQRLVIEFEDALANGEFQVFYQPKFDIRGKEPVLASAEALVRWKHHSLGEISPVLFIPLFESNGLIRKLDLYVWRKTAEQIREWQKRYGKLIPISVNVSRIDLYDPCLCEQLQAILKEYDIQAKLLPLEITESVYERDHMTIVERVKELKQIGFPIEMDDFGTGYSTLSLIRRMPVDVLKIDMSFIREAFRENGDTGMIGIVIDIARYLKVPTIAEGVEDQKQYTALKRMGCDIVQGYYFSKPVNADIFGSFIENKKI